MDNNQRRGFPPGKAPSPEEFMAMMQNTKEAQEPIQEASNGLYRHKKLRKGQNLDFYDNVWDDNAALDYTQGAKQRDPNAKVPTLQKDRDPRTFEADKQANLEYEMQSFFKRDYTPKNYSLEKNSPHYDKLISLLRCAPVREPESTSYIHDALSNIMWDDTKRHMAMRALMEYNFDPNREWNSEFPIERATRMGDVQSASILLQHGAHVHVQDKRGFNLLSAAIENGHSEMIPLLARYGAKSQNTAAGDSPLMIAILRLRKTVKENPEGAYTEFYKTVGYMQTYKLFNPGHKKGTPLIEPGSPEYHELELVRNEVGHDHKQMFQVMTEQLDKLEPFDDHQMAALRSAAPTRIAPFTNEGGVQSTPKSFFLSPKNLRDVASRHLNKNILKNLNNALEQIHSDADFLAYSKSYKFGKESFFNETIPKFRDQLNLDTPKAAPPHDTMIHQAARIGSPAMLDFCLRENCNLHVVNSEGDYPIHLVAQLKDKRAVKEMLTKMLGTVNPATGQRESLYDNNKFADMRTLNAHGQTFLEVIAKAHDPEFAAEVAAHLQLGMDPRRDLNPDLATTKRPDLPSLNDLRLTPVRPLTTNVLGAPYIGIDPNGPTPPIRKSAGNETPEELRELNKKREDDIYRITAMLESPDASDDRKAELRTALKSTLGTMPVAARVAVMNNAMLKIDENLGSDPERKGSQHLNELRRGVYLRMASDLAQTLKDPVEAGRAILDMELYTPEGKPNGFKLASAIAAVEGDADAMNLTDKIAFFTDAANRARFENDPNFKDWYNDVTPSGGSPEPKSS